MFKHPPKNAGLLLPSVAIVLMAAVFPLHRVDASWWNPWSSKKQQDKPKQLGENVKVRIQGNKVFSERKLRGAIEEQLSQIRSEGLTRPNADDAAYYLAAFYHQNGYATADTAWDIQGGNLLLTVTEGRLVRLRSTGIAGNKSLPSGRLISRLTSVTTERLRSNGDWNPFVVDDLAMGASRIVDLYQSEGFLDAKVGSPEVTFSTDGSSADVLVTVEEGTRYSFGAVRFSGNPGYPEDELRAAVSPLTAQPYTAARQASIQSSLQQFYAERAHFDAVVEVEGGPSKAGSDGSIPLNVAIHPGPTYTVESIDANGLVRIRAHWLQNRLSSLLGRPFQPDKLARKQNELMASGIFESLKITPVPQSAQTLQLKIDVKEAKARDLGFSLGFGSYEGLMGSILLADRNLFGRALPGSVELGLTQRSLALEATLADPWLFETRTEFVTRTFIRSRFELGYNKREAGVRGELSRRLVPTLQIGVFGQIRTIEVTSSDIPPTDLGSMAYQIGTVGASAIWDRRDNAINPTTGWIAALVSDSNTMTEGNTFARTSGRFTWHYPLPGRIRFAASGRFGFLTQRSAAPIDERYFLGGAGTVRSFKERELGNANDHGFPTGGSAYSLINAETDFPIWNQLRGAVFYDTGSLSLRGGAIPADNFRSAVGIGLRYALPVGPVRLDVGINPDRRPNEEWGAAHLSFGFAF